MEKTNEPPILRVTKDYVGRNDLKAMVVGQAIEFVLPDTDKLESARSCCNQMKLKGMGFTTKFNVMPDECSITIKRLQ